MCLALVGEVLVPEAGIGNHGFPGSTLQGMAAACVLAAAGRIGDERALS